MAKGFGDAFDYFTENFMGACEDTMRATVIAVTDNAIIISPWDKGSEYTKNIGGTFRSNWYLTGSKPSAKYVDKPRDMNIARNEAKIKALTIQDWSVFNVTNNSPQARVIEYGGYPNPVALGTRIDAGGKGVEPVYEKRSSGGYSLLAPSGVLRVSVAKAKVGFDKIAKEHLPK